MSTTSQGHKYDNQSQRSDCAASVLAPLAQRTNESASLASSFSEFANEEDAVLDILDGAADGLAAMADTGGPMETELGNEPAQ